MGNINIDLNNRAATNVAQSITQSFEKPAFENKSNIYYNGYIQNMFVNKDKGVLLTSGKGIEAVSNKALRYNGKEYPISFNYLLTKSTFFKNSFSGELKSSAFYNDKIYCISDNNNEIILSYLDSEGNLISSENLDCTSAVISSVYDVDSEPILCMIKTEETGTEIYSNLVTLKYLESKEEIATYSTTDFIPLGYADSATIRNLRDGLTIIFGCWDIDNNKTRTLLYNCDSKKWTEYKWFGKVAPNGDITGEPIPDLDSEPTRLSNGCYVWNVAGIEYDLYCGYTLNSSLRYNKIVIDSATATQQIRTNMSVNDTASTSSSSPTSSYDPMKYFISNYADSKGLYYDYGLGWCKTYVRKTGFTTASTSTLAIYDCYLYTFGCKTESALTKTRKESLMAKGNTATWTYTYGSLNSRVYTVGGTNTSSSSILSTIPFTVEVLPQISNTNRGLDMQMYGLTPLSWSFSKTLITTASEENRESYTVSYYGNKISLCVNNFIYIIEKTDDYKLLEITKIADFNYRTNILDGKNLIIEDRNGNIELQRGFIPYNMEAILSVEDLSLTPPAVTETDNNCIWYWAAANNQDLENGPSSSYLFSVLELPLYISSTEMSSFTKESLEQKNSILKPFIRGLYDNNESIDIYYTINTSSTTLEYKSTNVVSTYSSEDNYNFGQQTFDVDKQGTYYIYSTYSLFPIGIGSKIEGINYINPTVVLDESYSAKLLQSDNLLKMVYNYNNKIYLGNEIFTIYGGNYYYDGQGIYYTGSSTNLNDTASSNQFTCYALGMTYLASSGSEAYFYSNWEKRLYIFNASGTMQPSDVLSNVGEIIDAVFSSKEQILYLLTNNNELILRSSSDSAIIKDIPDDSTLIGTDAGCGLSYKQNEEEYYILYSPRELEDYDFLNYKLSTQYLGINGKQLNCNYVDVLLYKVSEESIKVKMTVSTFAGIERNAESASYIINNKDWRANTFRMRITPKMSKGQAFKVLIESDSHIAVCSIDFGIDDLEKNPSAPRTGRR